MYITYIISKHTYTNTITKRMWQKTALKPPVLAGFVIFCLFICSMDAKMLPPTLPWFTYAGVVEDLGQHLRENLPPGHRNVILFARKVTLKSNIDFNLTNYVPNVDLTVVCETLKVVSGTCTIDLSCKHAPDMISFNDKRRKSAWGGKDGCHGGSFSIFAKNKIGSGDLVIDARGGDGGRGQAGYIGSRGSRGDDGWFNGGDGGDGEDGGDGGDGGNGGNAGDIGVALRNGNPSTFIQQSYTSGGSRGEGGNGGEAGEGGLGGSGWWSNGDRGDSGDDGEDGSRGSQGDPSECRLQQVSSDRKFRQMLPITGGYLQRALNVEMFRIILAKIENDTSMKAEIRSTLNWIGEIAVDNGYEVVHRRCNEMSALFDQDVPLPSGSVEIEIENIRDHFDELEQVVQRVVNVEHSDLTRTIQTNDILKKHSNHARGFNNLDRQYNSLKSRCQRADEIADDVSGEDPLSAATREFISTPFQEHLSNEIRACALKNPHLAAALDSRRKRGVGIAAIGAAEYLPALAASSEAGALAAGVIQTAGLINPVVIIVATTAVVAYQVYNHVEANLENHRFELRQYEADLRARAKLIIANRPKLDTDRDLPDPPIPRLPYLRPKRRIPPRGPDRRPKPVPVQESGKFVGVLTKCEPVEGSGSEQVVATFDAVNLAFTIESLTGSVDINALDPIQEGEMFAQLEAYRFPLSILPAYLITTVQTSGVLNENVVGRWFEFNVVFEYSGTSEASAIIPIVTLVLGQIHQTVSGLANVEIPLTIVPDSIKALVPSKQSEITTELGLTSVATTSSKKRSTRQAWPNLPNLGSIWNNILRATNQAKLRAKHPLVNTYRVDRALVANVGQGSFNILYQDNRMKVVYDMGFGHQDKMTYDQEVTLIQQIENDSPIMVISHWDQDHYDFLRIYPALLHGKIFIVPSHGSDLGVFSNRIYTAIPIWNRISYGPGQRNIVTSLGNVNLRMTTKTTGANYDKNSYGALTACVMDDANKPLFLMPGDASYNYIDSRQKSYQSSQNYFANGLRFLVATHHGSTTNTGTIPPARHGQGTVLFSYGLGNHYGHSLQNAQQSYVAAGWTSHWTTIRSGQGSSINLGLSL